MKIGFILECTPKGPDADIYPWLAKKFCSTVEFLKPETLGNKQKVMTEGPLVAQTLFETGCDYVFIIWDRMPKWGGSGNCLEHKAKIVEGIDQLELDHNRIILCCISDMLESWMIADGRGITAYFQSLTTNPIGTFPDHKSPSEQTSPKERISKFNGRYNDFTDNFKIVQKMPDFNRAAKWNTSFAFFKESVEKICSKN